MEVPSRGARILAPGFWLLNSNSWLLEIQEIIPLRTA
jgi:hypothetical protein